MSSSTRLFACSLLVLAMASSSAISALDVTYGGPRGGPTAFTGLEANSNTYNGVVTYNESFNDIWTSVLSPSPVPTFWNDQTGAENANTVLKGGLAAATGDLWLITPYEALGSLYLERETKYSGGSWSNASAALTADGANAYWGMVEWEQVGGGPAVPEPSTGVLFGFGLAALAARRRRKKK